MNWREEVKIGERRLRLGEEVWIYCPKTVTVSDPGAGGPIILVLLVVMLVVVEVEVLLLLFLVPQLQGFSRYNSDMDTEQLNRCDQVMRWNLGEMVTTVSPFGWSRANIQQASVLPT